MSEFETIEHHVRKLLTDDKDVVVPEGIEYIGSCCFSPNYSGATAISSIKLPSTLKGIYSSAFSNCNCLTKVEFPQTPVWICDNAFFGCTSLKMVTVFPGSKAFKIADGHKVFIRGLKAGVPEDHNPVKSFSQIDFQHKSKELFITIRNSKRKTEFFKGVPDTVFHYFICMEPGDIPHELYEEYPQLENFYKDFAKENAIKTMKNISTTAMKLDGNNLECSVSELSKVILNGCDRNKPLNVKIVGKIGKAGLGRIRNWATKSEFNGNINLDLKDATNIESFPDHVFSDNDDKFPDFKGFLTLRIPDETKMIGYYSLYYGYRKKGCKIILGENIESLQSGFPWRRISVEGLKNFSVENGVIYKFDGKIAFGFTEHNDSDEIVLKEGVEEIREKAFSFCKAKKIVLPQSLKRINSCGFEFCENLEEIILPDGIEFIGKNAFIGCTKIRANSIKAPSWVNKYSLIDSTKEGQTKPM